MKNDPYIVASFLKSKLDDHGHTADGTHPVVTISRQHGVGGHSIAMRIAEILTERSHGVRPWIAVDKNIAEHVLKDHRLPKEVSTFLTEEQLLSVDDYLDHLLALRTAHDSIVEKMTQTIRRLANIGNIVLVGHGAHVITAGFPRALHVRLVGSLKRRVARLVEEKKIPQRKAEAEIKEVDHRRRGFLETYFKTAADDIMKYDLVLNTDRISKEEVAQLVSQLVNSPDFRAVEARQMAELRHQVLG